MNKKRSFFIINAQFVIILVLLSSCAISSKIGAPIEKKLKDGFYEGKYSSFPIRPL